MGIKGKGVLRFWRLLAGIGHSSEEVLEEELNINKESWSKQGPAYFGMSGYIEYQSRMKEIFYGRSKLSKKRYTASYNSCEVIAVYNALKAVKAEFSYDFPELLTEFGRRGITLSGFFGTSVTALVDYLNEKKLGAVLYQKKQIVPELIAAKHEAFIVSFWNNRAKMFDGIHTICISKEINGFTAHNYSRGDTFENLSEVLSHINKKGKLISVIGVSEADNSESLRTKGAYKEFLDDRYYGNREISWLTFNERILNLSMDKTIPLKERINFFLIFQSNLDEFYRVRVGKITKRRRISEKYILSAIKNRVSCLNEKREKAYSLLRAELFDAGLFITNYKELTKGEQKKLSKYIVKNVAAKLNILKCDIAPALEDGRQYIYAQSKLSKYMISWNDAELSDFVKVPGTGKYILLSDAIHASLDKLIHGQTIVDSAIVRVTRSAEIDILDITGSMTEYRDILYDRISNRDTLPIVRVEAYGEAIDTAVLSTFLDVEEKLIINESRDYVALKNIETEFGMELLAYSKKMEGERVLPPTGKLDAIIKKDYMLSYPTDDFSEFIELLNEAAEDEKVTVIRLTLYRFAERSRVADALIKAARNGKRVDVIIELKARFSELSNIEYSKVFEAEGINVSFALKDIKTHSKLCIIGREGSLGTEYILQTGTGNYNEITAKIYTDISLFTANPVLTERANEIFDDLMQNKMPRKKDVTDTASLFAGNEILPQLVSCIDGEIQKAEAGYAAYIGIKANGISDKEIIDKLIQAAEKGVKVEIVSRGICNICMPAKNIKGSITVRSLVGRYLEHSRIYIFGRGVSESIYISSADLMTRNLRRRVEVLTPIFDRSLKARVRDIFEACFTDDTNAWQMERDGSYRKINGGTYDSM